MYFQAKTRWLIERDAKNVVYANLIEILSKWPTLPPQVREEVLSLVRCQWNRQVTYLGMSCILIPVTNLGRFRAET